MKFLFQTANSLTGSFTLRYILDERLLNLVLNCDVYDVDNAYNQIVENSISVEVGTQPSSELLHQRLMQMKTMASDIH